MKPLQAALESKLAGMSPSVAVELPGGARLGASDARVTLQLHAFEPLAHLAAGEVGRVAADHVEGKLDFVGTMRDLIAVATQLVRADPAREARSTAPLRWLRRASWEAHSRHSKQADARQIRFHYDLSDAFYALWLDPRRVYSCAYYRDPSMTLAQAQEAKLDHICRKLMLQPGERFLDIGAGWGALLLWAAERYGVVANGITLSQNQYAHVQRLIEERGLQDRVTIELRDYRDLPEDASWDKIASVGMFEHVGRANLGTYFAKIRRLLKPGGLLMNHGITAGGTRNRGLAAGISDFIERYIFPGGELQHLSLVLREMADAGLEALDIENLRPHYAKTLWAWSDALEANLERARELAGEAVLRAYRLYLAGSAMSFEQGWISLHQMLASRPTGNVLSGPMRGAQSQFPFNREYIYR